MSCNEQRVPLFAIVALSGAAALSHELLWTRRLVDFLGSSQSASARVLGTFFLGLALGAALASWRVPRVRRPWRALAIAEAAIALLSLPALTLPDWSQWIWQVVGTEDLAGSVGGLVKVVVPLVVVAPPAMAMGFTLPLALAATNARRDEAGRLASWLYAVNTVGAVVGVVLVSGWLLSAFGLSGSMWVAISLNLAAAAAAAYFDQDSSSVECVSNGGSSEATKALPLGVLSLAFLSGVGVLAIEVIGLHLIMLVATMSFYAPAAILATMISMLAVAAALTPVVFRGARIEGPLTIALATGGLLTVLAPLTYWTLVRGGMLSGTPDGMGSFVAQLFGLTAAFIGPSALCVGVVFPLLMRFAERPGPRASAGAVAQLLAANGVGGLVGAEAAYRVLLPALGPHVALGAVGCMYCAAAVGVVLARLNSASLPTTFKAYPIAVTAVSLGLVVLALPELPTINPHLGFEVVAESSDRQGTLAVVDHPHLGRAMVVNNQYVLGSTAAQADQERQTHIPLLLHAKPERVALIGLATGVSAGASLLHEPVRGVEVLELSHAVIDAADRYFAGANRGVVEDSRARVLEEDGRTYINASRDRFDVIVGDLFLPWSAGVGRMYSVEHFEGVARALADGGVFCQWLPLYQLTEAQLEVIQASMLAVFPEVHLFRNAFHPDKPVLGVVAFKGAELSWAVVSDRAAAEHAHGHLVDPTTRHGVALAMLYLGRIQAGDSASPVNTLANLALELDAGRVRLSRGANQQYMQGQRWNDFLQVRLRDMQADSMHAADVRRLVQLGVELTTWEIARRTHHPQTEMLEERIRRAFPLVVASDNKANWQKWPGLTHWREPSQSQLSSGAPDEGVLSRAAAGPM